MALTLNTNVGFVAVRPTADPAGSDTTIDGSSVVVKDTAPTGAIKITEIGWYRGSGTNTANFEVALYADSAGVAGARLFVDATNSSSAGGWITTAVDWTVTAGTAYWLGLQMDAHTGSSTVDSATSGGSGIDVRTSQTTLNDPYGGGAVSDADGMYAIYALYQSAPTVALNSPADASSDSDTTPTFDFTGTDANADDIRYEIQVADDNLFTTGGISKSTVGGQRLSGGDPTVSTVIGSENAIIAVVTTQDSNTNNLGATTVARNGQSFSKIFEYGGSGGSGQPCNIQIWQLVNPDVGTYDTVADCNGTINECTMTVYPLSNCDTSDLVNGYDGGSSSGFAPTMTVTTDADDCYLIGGLVAESTLGSVGSGQDQDESFTDQSFENTKTTSKTGGAAGSNSLSVNMDSGQAYAQMMVAINKGAGTGSVILDKLSGTDSGFANPDNGGDTDPFTSGENIQFTVQGGDALATDTYYWRVRGIDPSGSNTYGAWSSTRSFTVTAGGTAVKDMIGGIIPFAR